MQRIELRVDPEIDAVFPGQRAAHIHIQTRDGRRGEHLQPTRKGDPEEPLSDTDLDEKFMELASPVIGAAAARQLLRTLWAMDAQQDIRSLQR
jgi:2-methylcitrate dehydratase PrpD